METNNLIAAIVVIEGIMEETITAIQFEDGSGNKFNYQYYGQHSNDWNFIDLTDSLDFQRITKAIRLSRAL